LTLAWRYNRQAIAAGFGDNLTNPLGNHLGVVLGFLVTQSPDAMVFWVIW
jgi:hypothetical protein